MGRKIRPVPRWRRVICSSSVEPRPRAEPLVQNSAPNGVEEAQDSGRAIVVEEGLTALLFSRAKEMNFFESQAGVSFDLLKTIQQFVQGYEVDVCPLKLWEGTVLQGYSVFRQVRYHNGGIITGDRNARTLSFRPSSISI